MSGTADPDLVVLKNLRVAFRSGGTWAEVVQGIDLRIAPGEIVGLVGESGSGKSVTAYSLLKLLPKTACRITADSMMVAGTDMADASRRAVQQLRGGSVSMVFQEPLTALNPILSIERQMTDVIRRHAGVGRSAARERARALLVDMLIDDPDRILQSFPHQLSGGMRQRVLLGMAFSCAPRLMIADEPTTALDVTVQAQILSLIRRKADETGAAVLFVTHDLGVVSQLCDRVYVLKAGVVVEEGAVDDVLLAPRHPYTQALLDARPERHAPRTLMGVQT